MCTDNKCRFEKERKFKTGKRNRKKDKNNSQHNTTLQYIYNNNTSDLQELQNFILYKSMNQSQYIKSKQHTH